MEPMTLGSPVHGQLSMPASPQSSLGIECSTSANTFYPSYLMGESQASASLRVPPGGLSPTRSIRPFSSGVSAPSPTSSPHTCKDSYLNNPRCTNERPGGPPTMGLLVNSPIYNSPSARKRDFGVPGSPLCTTGTPTATGYSNVGIHSFNSPHTPHSLITKDGHHTMAYDCDKENSTESGQWVTVFGFPLSSASVILSHFSQLGIVTDHRLPVKGNWMHIKFQNPLQAKKAMSKNGKVLNGTFMVGVVHCNEQSLLTDANENIFSPHPKDDPQIRPLTHSFHSPRQEKGIIPLVKTPQKSDSIVSKALQHILGI